MGRVQKRSGFKSAAKVSKAQHSKSFKSAAHTESCSAVYTLMDLFVRKILVVDARFDDDVNARGCADFLYPFFLLR
uniref:Uncharacterized protein n=1 Tax=Romanomermis culicivorax TaxID=13658 RepID=A0A915JR97_ROMCU